MLLHCSTAANDAIKRFKRSLNVLNLREKMFDRMCFFIELKKFEKDKGNRNVTEETIKERWNKSAIKNQYGTKRR